MSEAMRSASGGVGGFFSIRPLSSAPAADSSWNTASSPSNKLFHASRSKLAMFGNLILSGLIEQMAQKLSLLK
jgi:hypothetical protein